MKKTILFRYFSLLIILFYSTSTVFAGQVISESTRSWAKAVLDNDADTSSVKNSNSIAVLNYLNMSGDKSLDYLQKGLGLMLSQDLAKIKRLNVIKRSRTQALLDEYTLRYSNPTDPTSVAAKIGISLQSKYIVAGDIQKGGKDKTVFGTDLLSPPYEQPVVLPLVSGNIAELVQLEKEILYNIVEQLNVVLSKEERANIMLPLSESTGALRSLFLGLDYSDKGMFSEAAENYEQALALDPGLIIARNALLELQDLKLAEVTPLPPLKPQAVLPDTAPEEEGWTPSLSTKAVVGMGVGIAGIIGIMAISGSSDSDDEDGDSTDPDDPDDTDPETPTATISTTNVSCAGDTVTFNFSESMDMNSAANVEVSPFFSTSQGWLDDDTYQVLWSLDDFCDNAPNTITMSLDNFSSDEGVDLGGTTVFELDFLSAN